MNAKVEVAPLVTRVVSFFAEDDLSSARLALEAASTRLEDHALGIFAELALALRIVTNDVALKASNVRGLTHTIN